MSRTRPAPHDIQTFSITAPADNQVLTYNGTDWANEVPPWFAIQYVDTNLFGPGVNPNGNNNTVYGSGAMSSNLLGGSNVAIGPDALTTNQYSIGQIAIGTDALKTVATTTHPVTTTQAGDTVLIVTAGDTDFTLIGAPNNTPGTIFTATGAGTGSGTIASHYVSYGNGNTAIGYQSLKDTTTGYYNVAVGNFTLMTNTTGSSNVAVGSEVMFNNTTGGSNVAYGWQSLYHNTVGSNNTVIGDDAMWNNTTGSNNTVVGSMAGLSLTTGSNNTLIGGYQGTAGMAGNVVLSTGDGTVRLQHDGTQWTSATPISTTGLVLPSTTSTVTLNGSVGTSGQVLTSAGAGATPTWSKPYVALSGDTMAGELWALQGSSFRNYFVASGDNAAGTFQYRSDKTTLAGGSGTLGTNGTEVYSYLGCGSTPWNTGVKVNSSGTLYNTLTGGTWVNWNSSRAPLVSATCALGDTAYMGLLWTTPSSGRFAAIEADPSPSIGTSTVIAFHVGTLANAVMFDGGGSVTAKGNVTAYSDAKIKKDLEIIPNALEKVMMLTGYTYTRIDTDERQTGLIAQDVQAVLPEAVSQTKDDVLTLAYGNLVGLLVEAIKELKAEIEELKK